MQGKPDETRDLLQESTIKIRELSVQGLIAATPQLLDLGTASTVMSLTVIVSFTNQLPSEKPYPLNNDCFLPYKYQTT